MKKRIILIVLTFILSLFLLNSQERRVKVVKKIKGNEGKRWAICIGINNYEDSTILDLKKARNDAKMLGKVLKENGQFDHVYIMTDDLDARKDNYPKLMNIKRKLDFLKGFIEPGDLVVFSFSGHGISDSRGEGLLILADSYSENLHASSIRVKDIVNWLEGMRVKKSLLLLDACREHFQQKKGMNLNGLKAVRFQQAEVAATFYATKSGWFSYEDETGDYGVFTKHIIEGLTGKADDIKKDGNGDGIVSFSELASYVEEAVTAWSLDHGKKQKPYTKIYGEKYGDLALSAAGSANISLEPDLPSFVKTIKNKANKVYKNSKGYWEAEFDYDIVMIYIPAGEFTMGSDEYDDEKPVLNVYLDGYWISKHEITVGQFKIFANDTGYRTEAEKRGGAYVFLGDKWHIKSDANWRNPYFDQNDYHPVVCVSWNDANAFCNWISRNTGLNFHLPAEAQWEKAARGTDERQYPRGNFYPKGQYRHFVDIYLINHECDITVEKLEKMSKDEFITLGEEKIAAFLKSVGAPKNFNAKRVIELVKGGTMTPKRMAGFMKNMPLPGKQLIDDDGYKYTAPVGFYPDGASSYGLLDMVGNVWEWCSGRLTKDYYNDLTYKNYDGPLSGTYRVLRGGGWSSVARHLNYAKRDSTKPALRCSSLGFRLAMD